MNGSPQDSSDIGLGRTVLLFLGILAVAAGLGFVGYQYLPSLLEKLTGRSERRVSSALASRGKLSLVTAPISVPPPGSAVRLDVQPMRQWAQRNFRAAYDRAGRRNPKWDDAARQFIDRAIPWFAGDPAGPDAKTIARESNAVLQLGCDDPLIFFLAGRSRFESDGEDAYVEALLSRALTGFETTAYPRGVARLAASGMLDDFKRRQFSPPLRKACEANEAKWIQQSLQDGSFATGDEWAFMHQFAKPGNGRNYMDAHGKEFNALVSAAPTLPAWIKSYFSGRAHYNAAWKARGSGYSNSVSADGWKVFEAEMDQAQADLTAAWKGEPRRPEAAALMISVSNAFGQRSRDGERIWFDRTIAAEFDYVPAYTGLAWSLRPRWGGSIEAMKQFGLACAATKRFDTVVPAYLFNMVSDVDSELSDLKSGAPSSQADPKLAEAMEATFAGYEQAGLSEARLARFRTRHAQFALRRKDYTRAAELMRANGWISTPAETGDELDHSKRDESLPGSAAIYSSAAMPIIVEAAKNRDTPDTAKRMYEDVLRKLEGANDPGLLKGMQYTRARLQRADDETRLKRGEWIPFMPSADLLGWDIELGSWEVLQDGALRARPGSCGSLLVREMAIGDDFEIRGTIEFSGKPTYGETVMQGGIVCGSPSFWGGEWSCVRLSYDAANPAQSQVRVAPGFSQQSDYRFAMQASNTFLLRNRRGRFSLELNGQQICTEVELAKGHRPSAYSRVGFGGYAAGHPAEIRYRKIELRRLDAKP